MQEFKWTKALSVGSEVIDRQHQTLIAIINDLPAKEAPEFHDLVEYLLKYCFEHFENEEHWMRSIDYTDYEAHRKQHNHLSDRFHSFFTDYVDGRIHYAAFKQFLFEWLKQHILQEDRKIAEFVRNS